MPDTDPVAATLSAIRADIEETAYVYNLDAAGKNSYPVSVAMIRHARPLLAAVEAALKLAGPEPCDPDPHPEHPMIRLVRCDELREAITAALAGTPGNDSAPAAAMGEDEGP